MQTHPPFSPLSTPPCLRTGESLHLVVRGLRPHPWRGGNTSFGHLECQGGSEIGPVLCAGGGVDFICQTHPILASFDTTLSPHRRITAPSLCAAFAHIHGEAGTSALGIWSARVGQIGPVLCAGGGVDFICKRTPFSPLSTLPCLRTGESLHLVCARPSPTSMARREHQLWASGVPGWVRSVRFCVQEEGWISYANAPPILAPFDTTLSPHRRITAPSLCAAFAHIHGEAGTSALGIWSARVGQIGPVLCAGGGVDFICKRTPFSHPFRHTLSPHRRITAPSLCAAFAHISWRGGNISFGHLECQGGSERSGSMCRRRGGFHRMQTHPILALSTLPCLRTGESLHLVCARPSPTSHGEAGTSALGIWSARVGQIGPVLCAGGGVDFICQTHPHSRPFRHHPVSAQANHCT
jgi:hypothetical protein